MKLVRLLSIIYLSIVIHRALFTEQSPCLLWKDFSLSVTMGGSQSRNETPELSESDKDLFWWQLLEYTQGITFLCQHKSVFSRAPFHIPN